MTQADKKIYTAWKNAGFNKDASQKLVELCTSNTVNSDKIREALLAGADPNQKCGQNLALIIHLAIYGTSPSVKHMIEAGANINILSPSGQNAAFHAITADKTKCALTLIEAGLKLENSDKEKEYTLLMHAAVHGNEDVIDVLLTKDIDFNKTGPNDNTAATWASLNGYKRLAVKMNIAAEKQQIERTRNKILSAIHKNTVLQQPLKKLPRITFK